MMRGYGRRWQRCHRPESHKHQTSTNALRSSSKVAELLVVARSQEESIIPRFEADVLSVVADTLTQARTAARWERHGIGAQELATHLLDTSGSVKSATGKLSDYKRRMAIAIQIIVAGAKETET